MTLPNRPGYVVADKKPTQGNINQNELLKQVPFMATHLNGLPSQPAHFTDPTMMSQFFTPFHNDVLSRHIGFNGDSTSLGGLDALGHAPSAPVTSAAQPHYTLHNTYKTVLDHLPQEEVQLRKNYVRTHRLLPVMMELLANCKKDSLIPPSESQMSFLHEGGAPGTVDFGLDDFLQSQGIELVPLSTDDPQKNAEREEFLFKLEQLRDKYKDELEKLNRVCNDFCSRVTALIREQSTIRPVNPDSQQATMKIAGIQQKFDYVRNQLRQNVCNAILVLQKQYNQTRKKRRTLPKKATEGLSAWFFEHINDPYPSEEEKAMLAAGGGLTITQVNNWFGNKRIRYKRKCLEEESKRMRMDGQAMSESPTNGMSIPGPLPPPPTSNRRVTSPKHPSSPHMDQLLLPPKEEIDVQMDDEHEHLAREMVTGM